MQNNVCAIIQARMGSSRLPGKTLMDICGKPLLKRVIERVKKASLVSNIIIATTDKSNDDAIELFAHKENLKCFRGSEQDVLDRYFQCAQQFKCDIIVRITADDPCKDSAVIDEAIRLFFETPSVDYVSNTIQPSYPLGLDVEVFSRSALERAWQEATSPFDREHVTPYIWKNSALFNLFNFSLQEDFSSFRVTLDDRNDLNRTRDMYSFFSKNEFFGCQEIISYFQQKNNNPQLKQVEGIHMEEKLQKIGKKELEYITAAVEQGLHGTFNKRLEEEFAKKFSVNYAVGVNSGTSALHCALFAAGVQAGDEVIVPPLTFAAPAFAALFLNAIPVFSDINIKTFTLDPDKLEQKITKRTKAIIAVSLYGLPTDMDAILAIAKKHNIIVIEDNAECFLGKYKNSFAGSRADLSIFSFQKTKHMNCESGGMVITNSEQFAEKARKFSILGYIPLKASSGQQMVTKDQMQRPTFLRHEMIGFNYRLPELCAAVALAQLEKLDEMIEMRKKIAALYAEAVRGCDWLIPQYTPENMENSYWTFVVRLDTKKVNFGWEDFREVFLSFGGEPYYAAWSVNYFEPFLHHKTLSNDTSSITYEQGLCPVAELIQPQLKQFKTNFSTIEYAQQQANALKKTIEKLNAENIQGMKVLNPTMPTATL